MAGQITWRACPAWRARHANPLRGRTMVGRLYPLAGLALTLSASGASSRAAPMITVGTIPLQPRVNGGCSGYCGSLSRPLDPTGTVPGSIPIGFEWYPATDTMTPAISTILA